MAKSKAITTLFEFDRTGRTGRTQDETGLENSHEQVICSPNKIYRTSSEHASYPSHPAPTDADFWSIMPALFAYGHPASELPATLVLWAESNHADAFTHLTKSIQKPSEIRRTLAAIYRRMDRADDPFDQACLEEAVRNDPASAGFLRPYIARDEPGMAEIDSWDATWRGVRDNLDLDAVAAWHAAMKERP